ncbi:MULTISPECIES: SAF domain-containing protein [unclassified Gordonia (in: high G+C Gram-positive bacteria)]|uniref:SAF domain-containing protein n=1 Tax=unclassified Gordonia (in: high G+C Gram-positive bacteria) TaxID=2657482 RepID=UPI001F0EC1A5|nr:SAF domain-containing protein [Gordonia sp. ABSL49_1]MCH5641897.1 SAF domain-containing protein [Gordonia sp. ABSL49_1]
MPSLRRPTRTGLAPRWRDRLRHALRPGWTRSVLIRRAAAIALLAVAVGVGFAGHRTSGERPVLAAAHELRPGQPLTADDVLVVRVPAALVPDGALTSADAGIGRMIAGPVRIGEIVTDARLLTPRLPSALTGSDDARLVPVHLADDALTALLRSGDVVDVLSPDAEVLARGAVVALPATQSAGGGLAARTATRPVLLAMNESSAHRVAAVGLDAPLAVVLH